MNKYNDLKICMAGQANNIHNKIQNISIIYGQATRVSYATAHIMQVLTLIGVNVACRDRGEEQTNLANANLILPRKQLRIPDK